MSRVTDPSLEHDDLRRATHEAGHIVVAFTLGWPVASATIDRDPAYPTLLGHVRYAQQLTRYSELRAWGATFLGGREAERQLLGSYGIGSLEDERVVAQQIEAAYQDERTRRSIAQQILRLATATIAKRHSQVIAVRDALIRSRTLNAEELAALLRH
ncbi:MAG: hypothetical protein DCC58_20825 [Chloroflexi bacterium]|nr:MAG: hypothetical protein DCC58_20825 [Chloroflexota bacterium]